MVKEPSKQPGGEKPSAGGITYDTPIDSNDSGEVFEGLTKSLPFYEEVIKKIMEESKEC